MNGYLLTTLLFVFLVIGISNGNHIGSESFFIDDLSRNRTSIRNANMEKEIFLSDLSNVNTRRGNTEIPGNANVNVRRTNTEIQGRASNDIETLFIDDISLSTNTSAPNGRIEGTNQLNNRVTDAVAPDGSSVILTPVQEGAVQSLRTMLQSGQARGRPRLIGFLIPTANGRTRLRLMPAYLVRTSEGQDTIRLGRGRVNREGMPLNLRTIVDAARRANLLPTNGTIRARTQTRGQTRRPSMVVLRPRTSASAVGRTTRTRQLQSRTRGLRNGRRRQNGRRQQQTSGTSVDQVEVTINTSGGGTNNGGPTRNTQIGPSRTSTFPRGLQTNSLQRDSNRNRFLDTVRTLRQSQTSNTRRSDRTLRVLDRSPVDTSSNRNTIERTNIARSSRQEGVGQNVGTNRIQDMGRNRGPDAGLPSDPLDLFNTPRSMNLINSKGNSNGQSRDNRKVSITINSNQDSMNNQQNNMHPKNSMRSNNPPRDITLFDNSNVQNDHRFQNFGNQISEHRTGHFDNHQNPVKVDTHNNGLRPLDNIDVHHQQGQLSLNDLRHERGFNDIGSNIRSSHIDKHNTPTFIASASQSSNQPSLPHIDRQHFDINSQNSLHNNFQNQKNLNQHSNDVQNQFQPNTANTFHPNDILHQQGLSSNNNLQNGHNNVLNDKNLKQFNNNKVSQLSIQDIFPGLQFGGNQQVPTAIPINSLSSQQPQNLNSHLPSANFVGNSMNVVKGPQQNVNSKNVHSMQQPVLQNGNQNNMQNANLQSMIQNLISQNLNKLISSQNSGIGTLSTNQQQPLSHGSAGTNGVSSLGGTFSTNQHTFNTMQSVPSQSGTLGNQNPISVIQQNKHILSTINQNQQRLKTLQNNPQFGNTFQQNQPTGNTLQSLLTNLLQSQTSNNMQRQGINMNKPMPANLNGPLMTQNINPPVHSGPAVNHDNFNQQTKITQGVNPNIQQNNIASLLQNLLQQNNMASGANVNSIMPSTNDMSSKINTLQQRLGTHAAINNIAQPSLSTMSANQRRVINIQMQNALQPHDFGLSGGLDITHANQVNQQQSNNVAGGNDAQQKTNALKSNVFGQPVQSHLIGQLSKLLNNNPTSQNTFSQQQAITNGGLNNLIQNPIGNQIVPNNFLHKNTFMPTLQQPNPMLLGNSFMTQQMNNMPNNIPMNNNLQNPLNFNQGLRELLQQNIQQILMQQNNNMLSKNANVLGPQGFLGLNTATKSFPNNQLAPSDVVNENSTISNATHLLQENTMASSVHNVSLTNTTKHMPKEINITTSMTLPPPQIISFTEQPPLHAMLPTIAPFLPTRQIPMEMAGSIPLDTTNNSVAILHTKNVTVDSHNGVVFDSVVLAANSPQNITLQNIGGDIGNIVQDNITGQSNFTDTMILTDKITTNKKADTSFVDLTLAASNISLTNNYTDLLTATNITDGLNVANNQLTINGKLKADVTVGPVMSTSTVVPEMTGSNITMLSPDASSIQHSKTINATSISNPTTGTPLTVMDVLAPNGKFTKSIKKGLGIKSMDRATLKGLISNVLRDLFKQNFIDPVKGTLKSSLNYTTMLNSVKKVLLKSKDKLLRLKQRVAISPTKMQNLLHKPESGLGFISMPITVGPTTHKPVQTETPLPVTSFITTQPVTIKQPTLDPPTQAQVIIDSVGNHGVITNQNIGPTPGGGVAVWYSKKSSQPSSLVGTGGLSQSHLGQFQLSNPVIQPSGDLSVMGMANPTDISSIPVSLPNIVPAQITTVANQPMGFHDISNAVTVQPSHVTIPSGHASHFQSHVTESPFNLLAMSTQPSHHINIGKNNTNSENIADVASIYNNSSVNTSFIADSAPIQNVNKSDTISAKTNLSQIETVAQNTTSAVINTNEIKTTHLVSSPITTTQSPTSTTALHEDFIRMPNGTIISIALLESMDPEQAEMIAEMSEGGI